jgi:NTF2 fold immunity protein
MRKKKKTPVLLILLFGFQSIRLIHAYSPPSGYVPNEETAIAIAVAVWNPIYGKDQISKEKPYSANLADGVWFVSSTPSKGIEKGGNAIAQIRQKNGEILKVIHSK